MTKIFDVVHLNEHIYAIDRNFRINNPAKVGDKFYRIWYNPTGGQVSAEIVEYKGTDLPSVELSKVISTTDPSLGLPLLPFYEKGDRLKQFRDECSIAYSRSRNFVSDEIYKYVVDELDKILAILDKKYTEENMEAAVAFGMTLERFKDSEGKLSDNEEFKGFLQSLNPKPVQVEIEMDYFHTSNAGSSAELVSLEGFHETTIITPVIENGYVKVRRWIYE